MAAVISSGAVIATERSTGWTRQMRITPLPVRRYFGAKVLNGYVRAILTMALLALAGTAYGVRLSGTEWGTVIGLLLVGLIPFAALGVLLGHLLRPDSSTVAIGGIVTLFSLLGGVYGFQIAKSGVMFDIIKGLPSYWLVQAGRTALGGRDWPAEAWIVIAVWTAVLIPLAVFVYRRDTSRSISA
jgi:ABC-2 type transport system permease protein